MAKTIKPFLMFTGNAQAAMDFYVALFPGARIVQVTRYGEGEQGAAGTVKTASFKLAGCEFMCTDSPVGHAFTFTPSNSIFVECEDEAEFERLFEALTGDGKVLMPPDNYGFSRRFAWVEDRFGPSWQLNLAD